MKSLFIYLKELSVTRTVLWCYLIWYLVMTTFYFVPTPGLWLTSFGISVLIGIALILNTVTPGNPVKANWQLFRLFLIPFCVSSFSSLVKDHGFILIFSPKLSETGMALALCVGFLFSVALVRRFARSGN
jgi:hypothetical protein